MLFCVIFLAFVSLCFWHSVRIKVREIRESRKFEWETLEHPTQLTRSLGYIQTYIDSQLRRSTLRQQQCQSDTKLHPKVAATLNTKTYFESQTCLEQVHERRDMHLECQKVSL